MCDYIHGKYMSTVCLIRVAKKSGKCQEKNYVPHVYTYVTCIHVRCKKYTCRMYLIMHLVIQYNPSIVRLSRVLGNDFPRNWVPPPQLHARAHEFRSRCFSIVPRYINSVECVVRSVYTKVTI